MENQLINLSYHEVLNPRISYLNHDFWKEVDKIYYEDKKRNDDYFLYFLHYVNSKFDYKNKEIPFRKTFINGASYIDIYFDKEKYIFYSPFIKIKENTFKIPLYRKIAEINFNQLILPQIYLKENDLYFYYEDKFINNDPYKLFSILDEICYYNQFYLEYFIEKFQADYLKEPSIEYFDNSILDKFYNQYMDILNEFFIYYSILREMKYYNNIKNILITTLIKINYTLNVQGTIRILINDYINELYKDCNSVETQIEEILPKIEELRKISKEKFKKYCYKLEYFVFPNKRADIYLAQDFFKDAYNTIKEWMSKGYYMDITTYSTSILYDFLDLYDVKDFIKKYIEDTLKKIAKKKWEECAKEILILFDNIMNNKIPSMDKEYRPTKDLTHSRANQIYSTRETEEKEKSESFLSKIFDFFS
ncbi:MAG: hypothetical protein KatS3mg129_1757 [Leptospiraceae bacterium]|nr:MAG: hypothetical protein KatS3mg129_1757 [Leptospiraceae bacterium]